MRYKNGREAKAGDMVVVCPSYGYPQAGILHSLQPGSKSCNAQLQPLNASFCVTVGECLHVDDIAAAVIPDASEPPEDPPAPAVAEGVPAEGCPG